MFEIKAERFPLRLTMARGSGRCAYGLGEIEVSSKEEFEKKRPWAAYCSSGRDRRGKSLCCGELDWLESV